MCHELVQVKRVLPMYHGVSTRTCVGYWALCGPCRGGYDLANAWTFVMIPISKLQLYVCVCICLYIYIYIYIYIYTLLIYINWFKNKVYMVMPSLARLLNASIYV